MLYHSSSLTDVHLLSGCWLAVWAGIHEWWPKCCRCPLLQDQGCWREDTSSMWGYQSGNSIELEGQPNFRAFPSPHCCPLASVYIQAFNNAGLLLDKDNRKVKMHATVINTRYRTSQNEDTVVATAMGSRGSSHQRHPERESVDCRAVLNRFGDMKLGVAKVNSLHLSQRGQNDSNGFYKCISALQL